ncbi:GPI mannosyltransferase 1 isoform X2 [Condylostylus longicornis]|uniref:GPI mannosyltransferase 1 isoform X2 n=1 Tax=Condylostylus longicornis TaxID=2530218 RepID=UPI00244E4343|nr:GPI mannosyltransferase 1 isoform X2 [Condylostylus longicornis]
MIKILEKISFSKHLAIALFIRIILIIYGEIHDNSSSELSYTDIDYRVVTDGARYIIKHESPYKRHTYRYSPLMALLLVPNVLFFDCFGKILFSVFDIFVGYLIKEIVYNELKSIFYENAEAFNVAYQKNFNIKHKKTACATSELKKKLKMPDRYENWAKLSSLVWLYNPLAMVISTRGNGDSLSSVFVLLTLYYFQKFEVNDSDIILAGIFHGLSIHLRIYPVIFSLAYFLNLSNYNFIDIKNIRYKLFIPNYRQFLLVIGTIIGFSFFTGLFIHLYGWPFVYETYLYHFKRRDVKHNFSLYFLMLYLSADNEIQSGSNSGTDETLLIAGFEKALITMPQLAIFIYLSCTFGLSRKTLSFCIFLQTYVMVTYNTVEYANKIGFFVFQRMDISSSFMVITSISFGIQINEHF